MRDCPHGLIDASELHVGLPPGQMGNSEVGHMNIGAGRVVMQDLPRIDPAIAHGELKANPALTAFIGKLKASGGTCHLMGLLSPGGVHSHQDHMVGPGADPGRGRRSRRHPRFPRWPRHAALQRPRLRGGFRARHRRPAGARIATIGGRYFAMDRDKRWERVALAYDTLVDGKGEAAATADRRHRCGLSPRRDRRVREADGDGRLSRHEGRRRRADGQFPRRPRAADPDGAAGSRSSTASPASAS